MPFRIWRLTVGSSKLVNLALDCGKNCRLAAYHYPSPPVYLNTLQSFSQSRIMVTH